MKTLGKPIGEIDREVSDTIEIKAFAALDSQQLHEAHRRDQKIADEVAKYEAEMRTKEAQSAQRRQQEQQAMEREQRNQIIQEALGRASGAMAGQNEAMKESDFEPEAGG